MRLIRVFPRKTRATPDDHFAYVGSPDLFAEADRVHISVTFTWDLPASERLEREWRRIAPVEIGGPATGQRGDEFTPGLYLRDGYVITSRGCPRRCWFCSVWKRDGTTRELPVTDGWNVLDDNLLACSEGHVRAVFAMLSRQKRRVEFTGGLEARSLQDYQVDLLASLKPRPVCFFAYDPGDDYETLWHAGRRLQDAGFTAASHRLRCYVLIGYPRDTMDAAEKRLASVVAAGFYPMAMLWRPETPAAARHMPGKDWRRFQRLWARPAIVAARTRHP